MEKKIIVTRQELDKLFIDLMYYTQLDKVAGMLKYNLDNPISESEVFEDLKEIFKDLCTEIADREIDESARPIGCGRHFMMLEYTGGEPALQLYIEVSEAYKEDKYART